MFRDGGHLRDLTTRIRMNTAFIGELYIPQKSLFLSVLCVCMGDQPSCAETANPQVSVTGAVVCTRILACFCNTGLDCNCHDTFPKFISKGKTICLEHEHING